jgi:hypothetical protein
MHVYALILSFNRQRCTRSHVSMRELYVYNAEIHIHIHTHIHKNTNTLKQGRVIIPSGAVYSREAVEAQASPNIQSSPTYGIQRHIFVSP